MRISEMFFEPPSDHPGFCVWDGGADRQNPSHLIARTLPRKGQRDGVQLGFSEPEKKNVGVKIRLRGFLPKIFHMRDTRTNLKKENITLPLRELRNAKRETEIR